MKELKLFLQWCKINKIEVVAFLPPFADKVLQRMKETGDYEYLSKIYSSTLPIFKQQGFEYYNFPSVSTCNSNDAETIDCFHGREVTYLKILMKILKQKSIRNQVTNLKKIKRDVTNSQNRYLVYEY